MVRLDFSIAEREVKEAEQVKEAKERGKGYTPVVTGSMRNRVRAQGIEALRGAYDGRGTGGSQGYPPPLFFCKC